jgi:glyoxylase-like metal-dependent hydrolase (beta-lactamase superfamily II)
VDPESIDIVINTHLHWDHASGNTVLDPSGGVARPAFPRATYYTRRAEWEHAHERHPRDSVSYIDSNYDPLVESGAMVLLDADCEIAPGIHVSAAPGHNRDMMVVTASSGGETFCFFSDLVPTVHHLTPTWVPAFDLFPLETFATRTRLLEQAAAGDWICGFGHDAAVAFARVSESGGKFSAADAIRG